MKAENFAYWLQGLFEIGGESVKSLDETQVQIIKNHLNMVFVHDIDPKMGPKEHQDKLNALHNGTQVIFKPGKINGPIPMPTSPSFPPRFEEDVPDEFKGGIHGDIRMRC